MLPLIYIIASLFILWPIIWLRAAFLASKKKPEGNADKTSQRDRQGRCAVWRGGSFVLNPLKTHRHLFVGKVLL